ncbi:centrosomal protein of 41 kDa-like isoform X1 [Branchiostoma lanceolatum]|uniref:centrosomal protein of 41 kDa-like isoform X1 n=1 Tax=Branchiostoma lanceolatum TaxID=7740 RepID=UPI00345294ED
MPFLGTVYQHITPVPGVRVSFLPSSSYVVCEMTTYWVRRRKEEAQRLLNIVLSEHPSRYDPHYKYRRDEIFKRMKPTTFAQLILQVANISNMEEEAEDDAREIDVQSQQTQSTDLELANIRGDADTSRVSPVPSLALTEGDYGQNEVESPRSTLQSVIRGMGEVDMTAMDKATHNPPPRPQVDKIDQPYKNSPCVVLDIRDEDSYKQCHIIGAYNYQSAMLSRSMNSFSKELLEYKNAVGKIIIIYDEDERLAPHAATTLVERGVDNLFMLSGGMKVLSQKFPDGFFTGSLPPSCQPAQPEGKTPRTKNTPRAVPTNNTPAGRKMRFTPDDIQKIQNQLDESLIPSDTGSRLSRMSTNTSRNSQASMTSRTNNTTVGGKPWKPT